MPLIDIPQLDIADGPPPAPPSLLEQADSPETNSSDEARLFRYRDPSHEKLPHIVKYSGGLSSGLLLFTLLERKILKAERGDAIIFNNTSAEHPQTYLFARRCKQECEEHYDVPFFWVEYMTYEDEHRGEYIRKASYRLTNDRPHSKDVNEDGFHWRGEVFEELLSWSGYVPNQFSRSCTSQMKLETTRRFLKDWLAGKDRILRQGHGGETSRIDMDVLYERHKRYRGKVPEEIYRDKKAFALNRPHVRPEQVYADYSPNWDSFENDALEGKIIGGQADFNKGAEYVAFVGLRGDEPLRVQRVKARAHNAGPGASGYKGEHVYMPLASMGIKRADVNAFWEKQKWRFEIPTSGHLSNCVFCYLKGGANLKSVRNIMREPSKMRSPEFGSLKGTPSDIDWWMDMEKKYGRNLIKEGVEQKNKSVKFIGFFGANRDFSYKVLAKSDDEEIDRIGAKVLPCDCTE
ncbi:MAG: hypothetical protein OXT69_13790 [Candidatus Poribacteria bacterium]|nr:hypothetical protein [Candidatus Poribacteria bacterium]